MINDLKLSLRDVIPLDSGASFELFWDMLYNIRLLKYVRQDQLKFINPRYSKICGKKKMSCYCDLGLLNSLNEVYTATDKSLEILKLLKLNTKILPKTIDGLGDINQLANTAVFIQALKLPDFLALLYPSFDYIRPDALLIRGDNVRYKLEFLEVESHKPNWIDYLENKRINYIRLAKDRQAYSYWKAFSNYLSLPAPDINAFKFSVSIIGNIKLDFGKGFNFMKCYD